MSVLQVGDLVKLRDTSFTRSLHAVGPEYFPEPGTWGKVEELADYVSPPTPCVRWLPPGVTIKDGAWLTPPEAVVRIGRDADL